MNIYLAIITTVLVATQIVRMIQNAVQLHKQNILFKEQLGQLAECNPTEQDFETQRKAYRLIVEHFEKPGTKPLIIQDEKINVIDICVSAEVEDIIESHKPGSLREKLALKLGNEALKYATVKTNSDPMNYCVVGKAIFSILDKGGD